MLREGDQALTMVQDLVLSSLSLIVWQPIEVISLDDHLVQTVCATADDLSFEFIPFIHEALAISVPAAEWAEACTVGQVCVLVTSSYTRKPAHERQAVEARLEEIRQLFAQRSSCQRWRQRRRRLSWQRDARAMRRVLRSGALFKSKPEAAAQTAIDEADLAFGLARDIVFWILEGMVQQPRSIMTLDDCFGEPPYIEAELKALKIDQYNAPPVLSPGKWWHFWRWELPRWPV